MTPAEVLERLGSLSGRDRSWILRNLSAAALQRLREQTAPASHTPRSEAAATKEDPAAGDERVLERVKGEEVARALAGEPPWMIATLLGLRQWPWEVEMLAQLAPLSRLDVSQLRLAAPRASEAMTRLLLKSLRERVGTATTASMPPFEHLLQDARIQTEGALTMRPGPR